MKYALIIPDGCADEPQVSLGGLSPLGAANVPNMDEIAEVKGAKGVMLTFDDFLVGLEDFGTKIQPLMKTRAHVRTA